MALVTPAAIGNQEVSLILDSGSPINCISADMLNKLGLKINKKATKAVRGVHGKSRMPLGIYEGLPVAIKGVTVPTNVTAFDMDAYALLVGTAWLFKARATINLKNMTATLEWAGSALTVPVTCWAEKTVPRRPDSDDESDLDSEDDTSSDDDDAGFATDLCTFTMTDQRLTHNQEVYPEPMKITYGSETPRYGTRWCCRRTATVDLRRNVAVDCS